MKDPVVQIGAPVLRQHAKPLAKKDFGSAALRKTVKRMSDTLKKEPYGVAIAAPQVGESLRIFVIAGKAFIEDTESDEPKKEVPPPPDRVFINPEIVKL